MSEWILFDKHSIEELDTFWVEKNYGEVIRYASDKYRGFIQSVGEVSLQSDKVISNFHSRASDIDDERFFKYFSEVDIPEDELKLYLLKYSNSSKADLAKSKFNKEYVPFVELFKMVELCYKYELDEKKSLGYLMEIISTAGDTTPDFGYYVYKNKVKQYVSELSYFEKRKVKEKQKANNAGVGIFGPKDILDVLDSFTNILQRKELEIDDQTAKKIYTESAEEIISWGGNDTRWIGYQLSKLCQGLLLRGMYIPMYGLITDYFEYPITHKHSYVLEIMKSVSDSDILWDCIARMENYIKQNKEAKGFKLAVEPGRELLQKIIPDVLELIQSDILLHNLLTRYKGKSFLDEATIKGLIFTFKDYLLEINEQIEKASSIEILDILYKLTGDFKDLFYEFDGGDAFLDALYHEYHNVRQYKTDYFYQEKDLNIFQYDELEKEVLSCKNKVIITSVKNLREEYLAKLENAVSASEYELLKNELINEINKIINQDLNKVIYEGIYNDKKAALVSLFNGEENWLKLDEITQDFLISGEIVYDQLLHLGDKVDYSAAVIPLTKALENELYIYFHKELENYCVTNMLSVPNVVQEVNAPTVRNKFFSLGSIDFYLRDHQYHTVATAYLPTKFNGGYVKPYSFSRNGRSITRNSFSNDIYLIKEEYRNKVAHKDGINKQTAINCREHMLLVRKILLKFIDDKK
ncbi:hypothetical protein LKM13_24120 [Bacillus anthracis]|uniref:hypothetical protein n=1 Tax=Bacillus anthracis TaxID=1392 RepID=UPI001D0E0CD2|nr:hypothetical protein [Bacillus anthracis]MCC2347130.1 hypothetical protein [Bacillus anthracis]